MSSFRSSKGRAGCGEHPSCVPRGTGRALAPLGHLPVLQAVPKPPAAPSLGCTVSVVGVVLPALVLGCMCLFPPSGHCWFRGNAGALSPGAARGSGGHLLPPPGSAGLGSCPHTDCCVLLSPQFSSPPFFSPSPYPLSHPILHPIPYPLFRPILCSIPSYPLSCLLFSLPFHPILYPLFCPILPSIPTLYPNPPTPSSLPPQPIPFYPIPSSILSFILNPLFYPIVSSIPSYPLFTLSSVHPYPPPYPLFLYPILSSILPSVLLDRDLGLPLPCL